MPTIALTRAREEAGRSAARLAERGFSAAIAPVIETHATGAPLPPGPYMGILVTSAKALESLGADERIAIVGAPLCVVGDRAAEAAAQLGLALADPPSLDVAELAARALARFGPGAPLLYLAGEDRKSELERALAEAGRRVATVVVYAARARPAWSDDEAAAVAACDAVLHYSRRGAELAMSFAAAAGIADRFRALPHVCLSRDVAEPLRAWSAARVGWAATPREADLIEALMAFRF